MKKCKKCKLEYENEVNFCKKCGNELEYYESDFEKQTREKQEKRKKKTWEIVRYVFGAIIILGSLSDLPKFYGIIGILFGMSLLPIINQYIWKIKKLKNNDFIKKHKKIITIVLPIILGFLWAILLPEEQLETITINDFEKVISINEEYKIDFVTNLDEIKINDFKFTSSNNEVATVEKGIIKGKKEGTVTITIIGDNNIQASEEYVVKYVNLESIDITGDTKLSVGKNGKLVATLNPTNASDNTITWNSSNPEIISIDEKGNLTATNKGNATITATSKKGIKKEIEIYAYIDVSEITLSQNEIKLEKGKSLTIQANVLPENADAESLIWESSNESIVEVDNGKLTAMGEGNATITVKSLNGSKTTANVSVYEVKPESIKLNKTSISLSVGQTSNVSATISPSNASDKSISWSTSSYSVATVENGVITAKGKGTATITARTSNGKSATIEVTVTQKAPIKINNFRYTIDSVCGVEWTFSITNNSGKKINYITMKWYNFNAVGDFVYDQIGGKNYTALRYTGPLNSGANSGSKRNTSKFYNCSYKSSAFSEFVIDYADGTSETIKSSDMKYYTNLY